MFKIIRSSDSETNLVANFDSKQSFSHLVIAAVWTADAVPALTIGDMGQVYMEKRGQPILNSTWAMLKYYGDLYQGLNTFYLGTASTADGRAYLAVPRGFNDGNTDYTTPEDTTRVELTYGAALAAEISGFDVRVYVIPATGKHRYDMQFLRQTESLTASQTKMIPINQDNIRQVFLSDAATLPETLAAARALDNGTYVFRIGDVSTSARVTDLIYGTQAIGRVELGFSTAETAATTVNTNMAIVYDSSYGGIVESLQDSAELELTNGSGGASTAAVLSVGARFAKSNKVASGIETGRKLSDVKLQASQQGKTSKVANMTELLKV